MKNKYTLPPARSNIVVFVRFLTRILICDKILISDKKFDFWQQFWFLTKNFIYIVCQLIETKILIFSKIVFSKKQEIGQTFPKIKIDCKSEFYQKTKRFKIVT